MVSRRPPNPVRKGRPAQIPAFHSPLEKTPHNTGNGELPITCRNRHCPKCQAGARERWLEKRRRELLPTQYVHMVFTLPRQLAPLTLQNKKVVYRRTNLFFRLPHTLSSQHFFATARFGARRVIRCAPQHSPSAPRHRPFAPFNFHRARIRRRAASFKSFVSLTCLRPQPKMLATRIVSPSWLALTSHSTFCTGRQRVRRDGFARAQHTIP
jgi:hypothetical protein